jgi:hypothetical protein
MIRRNVVMMTSVACLLLLCAGTGLWAATGQQTMTINAAVADRAKLTLGVAAISFPAADPDTDPSIAAPENPVAVTVKVHTGSASTVTLSVEANGDLDSGSDTIAISNVTWTAAGAGFVSGAMDTSAQPAGSWTGSGQRNGTFSYFLANDWTYPTGSYSQTVVYTLTAP